jgi:hypothetical protein
VRQTGAGPGPATIAIVLIAFAVTGCVVFPMKATTRVQGAGGCSEKERLPKEAPVLGKTTRQEVDEGYRCIAVETGTPGLFWGRFRKSDWMVIIAAGGYGTGAVGGFRVWGMNNLLMSFSADGTVTKMETIDDARLLERLRALLKEQGGPPLDLTQPASVVGWYGKGNSRVTLDLKAGEMVVTEKPLPKSWKKAAPPAKSANVPVAEISEVMFGWGGSKDLAVGTEIRLVGKTGVGERVVFKTEPAMALRLARWLEQVKPQKQ